MFSMGRREFVTLLGGARVACVSWPMTARAQQSERVRRVGVLMGIAENDPDSQSRIAALLQGLQELGWTNRRNVHIDARWSAGDTRRIRNDAAELIALAPDVILANGAPTVEALRQAARQERQLRAGGKRIKAAIRVGDQGKLEFTDAGVLLEFLCRPGRQFHTYDDDGGEPAEDLNDEPT